jgi:hypothetical protein
MVGVSSRDTANEWRGVEKSRQQSRKENEEGGLYVVGWLVLNHLDLNSKAPVGNGVIGSS